jgi:hypothetical protein
VAGRQTAKGDFFKARKHQLKQYLESSVWLQAKFSSAPAKALIF